MTTPMADAAERPYGRGRRVIVALLLIVACVLAPLSVLAVWTRNTLLDTDQYVSTVAPLATNEAIIDAAAANITAALVSETDVEAKVRDALPPRADFIAPAVAQLARDRGEPARGEGLELRSVRDALGAGQPPGSRSGRRRPHRGGRPHDHHEQRRGRGQPRAGGGPGPEPAGQPGHRRLLGRRGEARQPAVRRCSSPTT